MSRPPDPSSQDYYALLGVEPSASPEAIREAFREKAHETHPDQNPDDSDAAHRFHRVQEAYRVLSDPERREKYDAARTGRRVPDVLHVARESPAGCGGYLWRVFAGGAAAVVFFGLEALGVWSAGASTIVLAVGGAAAVAGLLSLVVAKWFPDEATDVSLRLDADRLTVWADGRTVLELPWAKAVAVQLHENGPRLTLRVDSAVTRGLRPVPPVLVEVEQHDEEGVLYLNLAETDASPSVLASFLRATDGVPVNVFSNSPSSTPARPSSSRGSERTTG